MFENGMNGNNTAFLILLFFIIARPRFFRGCGCGCGGCNRGFFNDFVF